MKRLILLFCFLAAMAYACRKGVQDMPQTHITPGKPSYPNCKILKARFGEQTVVTYIYDSTDRITERIDTNWHDVPPYGYDINVEVYSYDSAGRLSQIKTYADVARTNWTSETDYVTQIGQTYRKVSKISGPVKNGQPENYGNIYEYLMDEDGKLTDITYVTFSGDQAEVKSHSEIDADEKGNILLAREYTESTDPTRIATYTYDDKYNPTLLTPEATILPTGINNVLSVTYKDKDGNLLGSNTYPPYSYNSTGYPLSILGSQYTYTCK